MKCYILIGIIAALSLVSIQAKQKNIAKRIKPLNELEQIERWESEAFANLKELGISEEQIRTQLQIDETMSDESVEKLLKEIKKPEPQAPEPIMEEQPFALEQETIEELPEIPSQDDPVLAAQHLPDLKLEDLLLEDQSLDDEREEDPALIAPRTPDLEIELDAIEEPVNADHYDDADLDISVNDLVIDPLPEPRLDVALSTVEMPDIHEDDDEDDELLDLEQLAGDPDDACPTPARPATDLTCATMRVVEQPEIVPPADLEPPTPICVANKSRRYRNQKRRKIYPLAMYDMDASSDFELDMPEIYEEELVQIPAIEIKKEVKPAPKPALTIPLSHEQTQKILDSVYKDKNAFVIPAHESQCIHNSGSNPTYGEIMPTSIGKLVEYLQLGSKDIVFSLGSGAGKEVLYVALATPAKAIGVELSETRHNIAQNAKQAIQKENELFIGRKAVFINKNILDINNLRKGTVFFISNLCFPDRLMEELADKLEKLHDGSVIITVGKQMPARHYYALKDNFPLPMTWSNSTPIYVYVVRKPQLAKRTKTVVPQQVLG